MRTARYRQLIALPVALLWSFHALSAEEAVNPLQTLKLTEAALAVTGANDAQWEELGRSYDALVAKFPKDAAILAARGNFRWERGAHEQAVADWRAALENDAAQVDALIGLGGAAVEAGRLVEAAALHRRAVATNPENAAAHFALANVLFLFRHALHDAEHPDENSLLREALARFESAAKLAPTSAEYARAYAETFYSLPRPDWEQARAAWEKVRELSPTKDFALVNLARVHLRLGQSDTSRRCLDLVQDPAYQRVKARLAAQLPPPQTATPTPLPDATAK